MKTLILVLLLAGCAGGSSDPNRQRAADVAGFLLDVVTVVATAGLLR